ncbi:MAG: hypothetical protein KY457_05880, partial [Actinobacteria bacterium]|nr:hypothetical protein [Actinomycetota bacterium]
MSSAGDLGDEMDRSPFDEPDLAAFTRDLRHLAGRAQHRASPELSAMLSGHLSIDKGDLPATAASNAHGSADRQRAGLPTRRFSQMRIALITKLAGLSAAAKIGLGGAVAAAAVGGGVTATQLPAGPDTVEVAPVGDDLEEETTSTDDTAETDDDLTDDTADTDDDLTDDTDEADDAA